MSTNNVKITPASGEIRWIDSGGTEYMRIIGDAASTNTLTVAGNTTGDLVVFTDSATATVTPAVSGYDMGSSSKRWDIWAADFNLSGSITLGGFTQGSVLFAGASGVVSQSNSTFFWDSTNTTLGVGTTRSGAISGTNPTVRVKGSGATASTSAFEVQDSGGNTIAMVRNDGYVGVGTNAPSSKVHLAGAIAAAVWGTSGLVLQISAATYTDTSSADSTVVPSAVFSSFAAPTLAAISSSVTTTAAATMYIAGAPIAGTNMTITNPYALWIDSGVTRLDGTTLFSTLTEDRVVYVGTDGALIDNAFFTYDGTTLGIGEVGPMVISGSPTTAELVVDHDTQAIVEIHTHSDTPANGSHIYGARSRGVSSSKTVVHAGDILFMMCGMGYDGTDYAMGAQIRFEVASGGPISSVGSDDMPSNIVFGTTADGADSPTDRMTIAYDGGVSIASLTAGRVVYVGTSGLLTDSATFTFASGQLSLSTTGSSGGLVMGGDAQWYRSAADVIRTPDSLIVDANLTVGSLTSTRVPFASTAGLLVDSASFTYTTGTGQLALAVTGSGGGLLIGGDAQWYRSAADVLRTPDSLVVDANLTVGSLTSTRVPFASTAGLLVDSANFTYTTGTGQLALSTTGSGGGLLIGGDAQWYRSAADVIRTPDSLIVDSSLTVGTLTAGSIPFAGTAGLISQNNSSLFWDGTNNTLGVGTTRSGAISGTNPLARVKGTGATSGTSAFEVQDSGGNTILFVRNDQRVGVGTNAPSYDLSFGGAANRTLSLERATSGAGHNLVVSAGGGQSGAADVAGGTLYLYSGIATGAASGEVQIFISKTSSLSGSSDIAPTIAARFSDGGLSFGTSSQAADMTLAKLDAISEAPYAYTISPESSDSVGANSIALMGGNITGGTDLDGGSLLLKGGDSSGTGASAVEFYTATPGLSGTTVRTSSLKLSISGLGKASYTPSSGTAALNFATSGTVSAPSTGDLWWDSGTGAFNFRAASVTHNLLSPTIGTTVLSGGTTGSVLFVGASSVIQQDNANLFWDDTNNTLGVGTTRSGAISGTNPRLRVKGSGATSSTSTFEAQDSAAATLLLVRDDGLVGLGTSSPAAKLHIAGNFTAAAWTTSGIGVRVAAATYTDSSSSGTVASQAVHAIAQPTLAASSSTTYTDAATLYIANAPAAGSNVIMTTAHALWVDAGSTRLDGNVLVGTLTSGRVTFAGTSGLLSDSSSFTYNSGTGQFAVATTGSGAGVLIGGDTQLYRSAADVLRTPDSLTVDSSLTVGTLTSGRVTFAGASGLLSDSSNFTYTTGTGELALATSGSGAGLLLGGDAKLYRRTTDIMALASGDSLEITSTGNMSIGTTIDTTASLRIDKTWNSQGSASNIAVNFTQNVTQTGGGSIYIMNVAGFANKGYTGSSMFFTGCNLEMYTQGGTDNHRWVVAGNFRTRGSAGQTGGTVTEAGGGNFSFWNDAAAATWTTIYGGKFDCVATAAASAGSHSTAMGGYFRFGSIHASATTTWTTLAGLYLEGYNGGAGAITTWHGIYGIDVNAIGTAATTTAYWMRFGNLMAYSANSQNRYGIALEAMPDPTGGGYTGTSTIAIWISSDANPTSARDAIVWGSSKDTNLYRSAADTLKTDDSLVVATNLTVSTLTAGSVVFTGTSGLLSQDNSNFFFDSTAKFLSVGIGASASARLHVGGNSTAAAWTTSGIGLRLAAATYTDSSSSGTVASQAAHAIAQPTFAASSSTTYTDAAALYIANAPAAGSNVVLTNAHALWVDAGSTRLDGNVLIGTLTSGRVPYASTNGLLVDSANFTFNGSVMGITATTTVTGTLAVTKALTSGVSTLTDGATPALDASLGNTFLLTAAGDRTIAVPTNPTSGQRITIVHKASGANRTLALNTGTGGFRFGTDITALTATTSGLTDYIGAIYNSADNKWDVVAYTKGF